MVRTERTRGENYFAYYWTSAQLRGGGVASKTWDQQVPLGSKAAVAIRATCHPGGSTSSSMEDAVRQLPAEARLKLVDCLTAAGDAGSGQQAHLAAARLCCSALRTVIDEGLQSLRFNILPDTEQGPAPSLSRFPNVTSLKLSIDAAWHDDSYHIHHECLAPGEQPTPHLEFRSNTHAYPPALLLEPLQGQSADTLRRMRTLTLLGQLTSFGSLCEQLHAVLGSAAGGPTRPAPDTSADASCGADPLVPASACSSGASESGEGSSAAVACSSGTGAGMGRGATGCCSLVHLHLGNACFPKASATAQDLARGHRALAALGVRELTLGVELLQGMEVHKVLHAVHVYKSYCAVVPPVGKPALASLRLSTVRHVDLLMGDDGWTQEHVAHVLGALPDTVDSVRVWAGPFRATLSLGKDHRGQTTRELLLFDWNGRDAACAVKTFGAWSRGLPPAARFSSVRLTHVNWTLNTACGDGKHMRQLLSRADRMECDTVRLVARHVGLDLASLQSAHVLPRFVRFFIPKETLDRYWELRLEVGPPHASCSSGGGAAAGTAQQPPGQQGPGPLTTTTLGGLWERAVGLMEARQRSLPGGGRGGGGGGAGVVLLRGPGVSGLAAHRTLEGWAALETALVQLWRSRGGAEDGARRECVVLPGGSGMLVHWGGEQLAGEEVAEAVAGAAAVEARGRGVQAGGVRAVVLRLGSIQEVGEELEACARQVLESTPLLGEDLVGQLEATAALWRAFASHWRLLQDCRYPAARCQASRYKPVLAWVAT